jgi:hypothetical protein
VTTLPESHAGDLEAVDRILNRGGDADDVLLQVVAVVHRTYPYAAIAFVEKDELVVGPEAGEPLEAETFPISFQGAKVGELRAGGAPPNRTFLERVALLISPYCLVGWNPDDELSEQ